MKEIIDRNTVPVNTVPVNNLLLARTVPVNKLLLTGTLSNVRRCWLAIPRGAGILSCAVQKKKKKEKLVAVVYVNVVFRGHGKYPLPMLISNRKSNRIFSDAFFSPSEN